LELTLGGSGKIISNLVDGDDGADVVALQPDGKVPIGGHATGALALVRYLPDGTVDRPFAGNGKYLATVGGGQYLAMAGWRCRRMEISWWWERCE